MHRNFPERRPLSPPAAFFAVCVSSDCFSCACIAGENVGVLTTHATKIRDAATLHHRFEITIPPYNKLEEKQIGQ
jgi:hypothetical protein